MRKLELIQLTPEQLKEQIREQLQEQFDEQTEKLLKKLQSPAPSEYFTRHELARLFKVDVSTIHNWTVRGILKKHAIGNRIYYKRTEVEEAVIPLNEEGGRR